MKRHLRVLAIIVPSSFLIGMSFELFMSYVSVGKAGTFYDVYRRKQAERIVKETAAEKHLPDKPSG